MSIQLKGNDDSVFSNDIVAPNIPTQGSIVGYQQGLWTPAINAGSSTVAGPLWFRIGNQVTIQARLTNFSVRNITDSININNFPYLPSSAEVGSTVGSVMSSHISKLPQCSYLGNSGVINFYIAGVDEGWNNLKYNNLTTNSDIIFKLSYSTEDTTWQPLNGATVQ